MILVTRIPVASMNNKQASYCKSWMYSRKVSIQNSKLKYETMIV